MTHPMDLFLHLQPEIEGGHGKHSQESGEIGFSSTLEHTFSEDYDYSAPMIEKESSVKVIPKEEAEVFEFTQSPGQLFAKPKSAEDFLEPFTKPQRNKSTTVTVTITTTAAQDTASALGARNPDKEMTKALPGITTIIQGLTRGNTGNVDRKQNLKGVHKPQLSQLKRRNVNQQRKRATPAGKMNISIWPVLMVVMASIVPVSDGSSAIQGIKQTDPPPLKCFTCISPEGCPDLIFIYNKNNSILYSKDPNQSFPECSLPITPTGKNSCFVCNHTSKILIHCKNVETVENLDVEKNGGNLNISSVCPPLQTPGHEYKWIVPCVVVLAVVVVAVCVLIYRFCRKKGQCGSHAI